MLTEITIGLYFLFVLIIGAYSALKIKQPDDYYVAGKKAGMVQVSGSLLATILGGSAILGTIELSQKTGWPALWFLLCASLGLFALIPLSKKVRKFGQYTLPEMLGVFYGKKAELVSSVIIPVAWLGIVAAQIIAAAKILSGLGFITYANAAILSGIIFILYTVIGGQLSILKTDTLQAVLILSGLSALFVFSRNGSTEHMNSFELTYLFNKRFTGFDLLVLVLTYSVTFVVGPDIYSRVFCTRSDKTATRSIWLVALILIPVSFVLTWLGVFSSGNQSLGIVLFAQDFLPDWAYGLFIAALLSAVMSSADTTLLTSSMIVNELLTGDLNHKNSLLKTRVIVVIIGSLSIVTALYITSIIQSLLFALTFFSGAFVVPTLLGLLNIKVNSKNVIFAILLGGVVALCGKIVHDFYHKTAGNVIIVSAYLVNFLVIKLKSQISIRKKKVLF